LKFMPLLMRHPVFWTKHLRTGYSVEGKVSAGRMMHERTVAAIPPVKPLYLFIPTQLLNQSKLFLPKQEGGSHYGIRIGIEICPAT
jgi:hypothetical protein